MKESLGLLNSQKRQNLVWPVDKTNRVEVGDEPGKTTPDPDCEQVVWLIYRM